MRYLIILLWLILGIIYFWIWNNGKTNCCDEAGIAIETPGIGDAEKPAFPLGFRWGNELPFKGDEFDDFRDSLIASLNDDDILEITGYYSPDEPNVTGEENLGLARAKEIRKLFPGIPDDKIRLLSVLADEKPEEGNDYFVSAGLKNAMDTEHVKEIASTAIIYFPFGSDNILNATEIDKFLGEVAEKVKASDEKILITGHTDDIGSDQINITVGLRRAEVVRNQLLNQGVPATQINTESKGKAEPLVPNISSENRAKNRRVELKIVK